MTEELKTLDEIIEDQEDVTPHLFKYNESYKPFHYPWAVELFDKHENHHWVQGEASLSEDVRQWNDGTLSESDKNLITHILRLFTQSDLAVGQTYIESLLPRYKNNEIRCMLLSFAAREGIHQRAYALLNDTLGLPEEEYHAFLEYSEMVDKWEFMNTSTIHSRTDEALALAKMIMMEGVSLFASFVMLLNFSRRGLMKGMCEIVEWSIRDETMHVEGNTHLFRTFCEEHPRIVNEDFKKAIYEMAREVVKLEDRFIDLAFELGDSDDLTAAQTKKYIRYVMDRRLIQMGLKGNWKVKKIPEGLEWLSWVVSNNMHANFFERRVTGYTVVNMTGEPDDFYAMLDGNRENE